MKSRTQRSQIYTRYIFRILLALQVMILMAMYLNTRTPLMWIWSVFSFVPSVIICLTSSEKRYVLPSLVILFISQQAIFIFSNPAWGFAYGSDAINDFHIASLLSEVTHFELGQLGYATRRAYSYYPALYLYSVALGDVSGISLVHVAMYFMPILNALLTTLCLYYLNHDLFGLEGLERNMATLFFEIGFVYTTFDSQFVRETFAFPLVLFSIWTAIKMTKAHDQAQSRKYAVITFICFAAVMFSHHVSAYLLLVILAILALSFSVFHRNNRLSAPVVIMAVLLGAYTSIVDLSFSVSQIIYVFEGLQAIFRTKASVSIMAPYEPWRRNLALVYYAIISAFTMIGGIRLLRHKRRDWAVITLLSFFVFSFLLSATLRLSTPADPWSFTYYMSLRGTIWAFIGISILLAIGFSYVMRLGPQVSFKSLFIILLIIILLAAGKFSQYTPMVSDSAVAQDLTYRRYVAALWLKEETAHGANILVAPYESDIKAFEGSRDMAPYAYLKEYFLEESKGHTYDKFSGYIPFIGGFFDQYENSSNVQIIYSNGEVEVGYKQP